jgi:glycosyltransferase involved in cell wall biosynthesis
MPNKPKPFFSIVIPTYNRAEKLRLALISVISQTFQDFEVLVVDDGSTDNTKQVVDSFDDSRITYSWAPNSGGPATPRNIGIDLARADWVCFLDADDIWYPKKLNIVHETIERYQDLDLICNNEIMSICGPPTKSLLKYGPFEPNFYRRLLIYGNRVSTSATTVRRAFLNQYNLRFNQSPNYVIVEDYDLWLRIAFYGGRFNFISEPLGEYVIENDNISGNVEKLESNVKTLLYDHVYFLQNFQEDKDRLWRHITAIQLMSKAKSRIVARCYRAGLVLIVRAIHCSLEGVLDYLASNITKVFTIKK